MAETDVATTSSAASASTSSACETPSIISQLRAALHSDLARKRKVKVNPPVGKKSHKRARTDANPKSVSPAQRVREFPNELLSVSAGKLFCTACREELGLKASIIRLHIKSQKHQNGKERVSHKEARERDIAEVFEAYNEEAHLAGGMIPIDQQVYRIKVVTSFLRAGMPLNKMDSFRELLEENVTRLAGRRSLSDLIPFIHREEVGRIKQEIAGQNDSVIFDGTSRLGEAMVIILQFVTRYWKIEQRLIHMQLLAKSLTGEEIARELITVLQAKYGISAGTLLASMHDRASTNAVALTTAKVLYPEIVDVGCFSHTLDHVGEWFSTPTLNEFVTNWIMLFAHSPKARLTWKTRTGISVKSYCKTRWWSR